MKPFVNDIKSQAYADCAATVLEVIPLVMSKIRKEIRSQRPLILSLAQYRALGYLWRHNGASLSTLADHLALTPSTASKIIDTLVHHQLVNRVSSTQDRRRTSLTVTEEGHALLSAAQGIVEERIAARLSNLSTHDIETIERAQELLKAVFAPEDSHTPSSIK